MKAPRKRCLVDGCEKVAKGRCEGRCQIHFKEYLAELDAADEANGIAGTDGVGTQARRTKFFCAVDDCPRQATGNLKGYCQRHYQEINPDGNAKQRVHAISKKCNYVDPANPDPDGACGKLAQGGCKGLCKGHWNLMTASAASDPNAAAKVQSLGGGKKAPRCKAAGCDKYSRKKGYCQRHFRELNPEEYKQASAEMDPTITGKRCNVQECTKWARGKTGMCRRHARELGLVQDDPPRKEVAIPAEEYGVVGPDGQLPVMDVTHEAAEVVAAAEETAAAAGAASVAVDVGYEAEAAPTVEGLGTVMQEEEPQDAVQAAVEVVNETLLQPVPVADPTKCSIEGCDLPPGTGGYNGMCVKHWLEIEKQKSVNESHRRRKRCSIDGCDKQAREYGMCHRHGRIHHGDQQNRSAIAADVADEVLSPSKRRKMDALVDVAAVVDDAAAAAAAHHHHHHHDPHHEMVSGDDLDHVAVQDGVSAAIEAVTAAELPDTTGMTREDHLAAAAEAAAEAVAAAAAVEDVAAAAAAVEDHNPQQAAV